jgi:hypothetical protein
MSEEVVVVVFYGSAVVSSIRKNGMDTKRSLDVVDCIWRILNVPSTR